MTQNPTPSHAGPSRRSFITAGVAGLAALGLNRSAFGAGRIRTIAAGANDPTIIFVHGFACAADDYQAQIDALSSSYRCIALDLPGHGASAMPAQPTMAALAQAVNDVKERSGARKVILAGHSMGSKVVREAYRQSTEGVVGLVFIDGSVYSGNPDTINANLRAQLAREGYKEWAKRQFDSMVMDNGDPKLRQRLAARAQALDPDFAEALLVDAVRWELPSGLESMKHIAVPTLLLQSTYFTSDYKRVPLKDGIKTPFMELAPKVIAQCEVRTISGVGHFPMIEAAPVVNQHFREFAARVA
ncbi:alpha/beta fold hydrolase [Variovorax saccharolyticus]|uniref:alpha/beta fold hydrolase n=1 Tax=Variovorax saccharolyticus TaxID=3053516 RepID=UPI00257590CC|nr:alpha/beta hydrolase [Variovorax sp. J22R187]MDM0021789.1 alpha/beta hydrolase [Variovorax sp. J22R187]